MAALKSKYVSEDTPAAFRSLRDWLRQWHRSFAIQLFLLHFRRQLFLLLIWLGLSLLVAGRIGSYLGFQYLFLDPEYLGQVGFFSFLLMGLFFGYLVMSWNLTTYLLYAKYFGFLASLSRPFLKFSINNALLPLIVLVLYCVKLFQFNAPWVGAGGGRQFLLHLGALLGGLILSLMIYMLYFYLTNRDIYYYSGRRPLAPNVHVLQPFGRQVGQTLDAVTEQENPFQVTNYLNNSLRVRPVRSVAHYDRQTLENVFRQNHWNALFLQFFSLVVLVLLGLLIDVPVFQLPAGASILILFSLLMFFIGAVSYWFKSWWPLILLLFFVAVELVTAMPIFQRSNYAYGLDYERPAVPYSGQVLHELVMGEQPRLDSLSTISMLNNWKAKQNKDKPPMVILCSSGGGLASATWAMHVVQELEKHTDGQLLPATVLMTGASGGMLGLAYLREVYYRHHQGEAIDHRDPQLINHVASDLLNPIAFSIVSNDIFLPFTQVQVGNRAYQRDRAYGFEQQLNINTFGRLDKPMAAYRAAEQAAEIPQLILTPSIVNDGRRLLLSAQGTSHLMVASSGKKASSPLVPDAVDMAALLGTDQRDSLRFLTALRMNATYPYVLPFVDLPTQPELSVMDAGFRDNYGVLTAARFIQIFSDWIKQHTSEVILIQTSTNYGGRDKTPSKRKQGLLGSLFAPLGLAGNFTSVQVQEQDNSLGYLYDLLGNEHFRLIRFNYQTNDQTKLRAAISFHLTEREKAEIRSSIHRPAYQQQLELLYQLLPKKPSQ